jgi:hypothetical protein
MTCRPKEHCQKTKELALQLSKEKVYKWLVTEGYFPEAYVLPPCFQVTKSPEFGKIYFEVKKKGKQKKTEFKPILSEIQQVNFPKTDFTDRTFGIIHPKIHSDISYIIANNWSTVVNSIYNDENQVYSYSFPFPLDSKKPGKIGKKRSGRMIYEWIEMVENDVASIAFQYEHLIKTDIKNFYPSIYTHSIPWALHGKDNIKNDKNKRNNYHLFGNRLDKLFQNANDGCTNGIPIGPVVSDLIAEIVLSGVDKKLTSLLVNDKIQDKVTVVRFKDDYRIIAKSQSIGHSAIKNLQSALKEYYLELNEQKTTSYKLPDGLFRKWKSQYYNIHPKNKNAHDFESFKELYLSVINIYRENPNCGIIEKFLLDDLVDKRKDYNINIKLRKKWLPKILSMLLMLHRSRIKTFPKILAVIESILKSDPEYINPIVEYLENYIQELNEREMDHSYLIFWIFYFLKSNQLENKLKYNYNFKHPIIKAVHQDEFQPFKDCKDFQIFSSVNQVAEEVNLLEYLDVFKPQQEVVD